MIALGGLFWFRVGGCPTWLSLLFFPTLYCVSFYVLGKGKEKETRKGEMRYDGRIVVRGRDRPFRQGSRGARPVRQWWACSKAWRPRGLFFGQRRKKKKGWRSSLLVFFNCLFPISNIQDDETPLLFPCTIVSQSFARSNRRSRSLEFRVSILEQ